MTRRVCLLTGASGHFGSAFIERYAGHYQIVAVHHRGEIRFATQEQRFFDPLDPPLAVSRNEHAVHAIRADLTTDGGIEETVREVVEVCGGVDLVIHAAAVRAFGSILQPRTTEEYRHVFDVNLIAPLRLSVALANALWHHDPEENARRRRNIVNVSSTAGLFVYEDLGQALYGTSKAALNHLTYHLASELWTLGVRVNAIAPDTFPGRVTTEEVLDAVIALDESEETGQVIPLYRQPPARQEVAQ